MIRDKLLKFCHENDINLISLIEELKKLGERLEDLDNEPQYLQKRFISMLYDTLLSQGMEPDEARSKKAVLFNSIFGKESARELMYQHEHMKGLPPINFFKHIFGDAMGREIVGIIERKYDLGSIERLEDYDQIVFVKHVINKDLGEQFPWWRKRLPLLFAQYIKEGEEEVKKALYANIGDEEKAQRLDQMVSSLRNIGMKLSKVEVQKLAYDAFDGNQELAGRYVNALFRNADLSKMVKQGNAAEEEAFGHTEQRIVAMMSEYMPGSTAGAIMEKAKADAGIGFLKGSKYYERTKVYESLTGQVKFSNLSTQRQAIVASWIKTWLSI